MKRYWVLILFFLILLGIAAAERMYLQNMDVDEIINAAFDDEGNLKPEYGEMVEEVDLSDAPAEVAYLIDGERSNIEIELEDGNVVTIGVVVEDKKIEEVKLGGVENPTSEITTSEETVEEILSADNPPNKFIECFAEGELSYESKSSETFLKGLLINTVASWLWVIKLIISFFSLFFLQGCMGCS